MNSISLSLQTVWSNRKSLTCLWTRRLFIFVYSDWPRSLSRLEVFFTNLRILTPQLRHPPLSSALTLSACLPTPLVFRSRLRVLQSARGPAAGLISLQPQPISYAVCTLLPPLAPPWATAHACSIRSSADLVSDDEVLIPRLHVPPSQ
jgi:hypothetical protein